MVMLGGCSNTSDDNNLNASDIDDSTISSENGADNVPEGYCKLTITVNIDRYDGKYAAPETPGTISLKFYNTDEKKTESVLIIPGNSYTEEVMWKKGKYVYSVSRISGGYYQVDSELSDTEFELADEPVSIEFTLTGDHEAYDEQMESLGKQPVK